MSRLAPVVVLPVLAGLLALPASAGKDEVRFKHRAPEAGVTVAHANGMKMDLNIGMQAPGTNMDMDMVADTVETNSVDVLSVDGDKVDALRVTFDERVERQTMMGNTKEEVSPVQGKTYTLSKKDGELSVDPDLGPGAPGYGELKGQMGQLNQLWTPLGQFDNSTLTVGEPIDLTALQNGGLLGTNPTDEMKMERGTITLTGTRKEDGVKVGVFAIEAEVSGDDPAKGMKMSMDMKGEMLVAVKTGWLHSVELTGPVTISGTQDGPQGPMTMTGTGTFTMTTSARYDD